MPYTPTEYLESLHTAAIDARNGYREALEEAAGHGLSGLFETMATLHARNAMELNAELARRGVEAKESGSLITLVNMAIIDIRSLFGGLNESILPGLIDGETRILAKYDAALASQELTLSERETVQRQHDRLNEELERMLRTKTIADQAQSDR